MVRPELTWENILPRRIDKYYYYKLIEKIVCIWYYVYAYIDLHSTKVSFENICRVIQGENVKNVNSILERGTEEELRQALTKAKSFAKKGQIIALLDFLVPEDVTKKMPKGPPRRIVRK